MPSNFSSFINLEHCPKRLESWSKDRVKRACKLTYHIENCLGIKNVKEGFENYWMPCCSDWVENYACEAKPQGMLKSIDKIINKLKNHKVQSNSYLQILHIFP